MPVTVRIDEKAVYKSAILNLQELLSLPGSKINPALNEMPKEIEDTLARIFIHDDKIYDSLTGLKALHKYRVQETLPAISAALDLNMPGQVIMHTRAYVRMISPSLVYVVEETFKSLILRHFNRRTKVWGKELDDDGFVAHTWRSTIPVAIPRQVLQFVRDCINPHRDLVPFFTGKLEVMTKGTDPFIVMLCQYGVIRTKLAFDEWEE